MILAYEVLRSDKVGRKTMLVLQPFTIMKIFKDSFLWWTRAVLLAEFVRTVGLNLPHSCRPVASKSHFRRHNLAGTT